MSPTEAGGGDDDDSDDGDRVSDDDSAFAEAVRGARPHAQRDARLTPPRPVEPPGKRRASLSQRAPSSSASSARFIVEQTGDEIAGRAADVSLKVVRELRAGTPAVEARLDVHGRRRAEALGTLESFVASARARGARALLVIHGRGHGSEEGKPVLRPAMWEWLAGAAAERLGVMAFASARPRDGGPGATVILLRRQS